MAEDIETKQDYLRSQILDKGYNPEKFSEYLAQVAGYKGLELENWTLEELSQVVYTFQSNNEIENPDQSQETVKLPKGEQENTENMNINKEIKEIKKEKGDISDDFEIISKDEAMKQSNKKEENLDISVCKKQERNTFTELPDLKVTITKKLLYCYNTE